MKRTTKFHQMRFVILFAAVALLLLTAFTLKSGVSSSPSELIHSTFALEKVQSAGWAHRHHGPRKGQCNPFDAHGRLIVDSNTATNNVWKPYDPTCAPSQLMTSLYKKPDQADAVPIGDRLPWFANKTILIHGDSIDRFHNWDFCEFVKGKSWNVVPNHPANPPPWREPHTPTLDRHGKETAESIERNRKQREKEEFWENRPDHGYWSTNPWVCDIEEYGATLITVFTFGLEASEEHLGTEPWYYPPAAWTDRLTAITKPLVVGLAREMNRPQIEFPDLIVVNSGYWDLRKWTEEDFMAQGYHRPYPEDLPIPYTNLSPEREQVWETETRKAIKAVAREFKGQDGTARSGPTILWRTLHHTPRHNYAPYPRVAALDSLARQIVDDLQLKPSHDDDEDLGLDERLRLDNSGALMLGQEHLFRDLLHPLPLPGSYLWADVMLYELKRAVEKTGRS